MKTHKISTQNFMLLTEIENVQKSKEVKNTLINEVIERLGDTYYNLSEGVKKMLDELCFLSKEKGFAYASPTYFMERYQISKTAVYDTVKRLREVGLALKVNKSSRNHNGLGKWVIILTNHPNFNKICSILNIEWKAERKQDRKAEIVEIPCESKVEEEKTDSTYCLPEKHLKENNNDIHINVSKQNENNKVVKFYKYVPKVINDMYAGVFKENLVDIWRKIKQAIKTINLSFDKTEVLEIGKVIIRNLFLCVKKKNMSVDEMCAYVYKATINMVYNNVGHDFLEDMKVEEVYGETMYYYASVDSNSGFCPTQYFFKAVCTNPLLYNWLEEDGDEMVG